VVFQKCEKKNRQRDGQTSSSNTILCIGGVGGVIVYMFHLPASLGLCTAALPSAHQDTIVETLTEIINCSLETGIVPCYGHAPAMICTTLC